MSTASEGRVAKGEALAWVKLPSESEMGPLANDHRYSQGFVPGMVRLLASHAKIGPLFGELFQQIMFGEGALSRAEREMVATAATVAQDCFY